MVSVTPELITPNSPNAPGLYERLLEPEPSRDTQIYRALLFFAWHAGQAITNDHLSNLWNVNTPAVRENIQRVRENIPPGWKLYTLENSAAYMLDVEYSQETVVHPENFRDYPFWLTHSEQAADLLPVFFAAQHVEISPKNGRENFAKPLIADTAYQVLQQFAFFRVRGQVINYLHEVSSLLRCNTDRLTGYIYDVNAFLDSQNLPWQISKNGFWYLRQTQEI